MRVVLGCGAQSCVAYAHQGNLSGSRNYIPLETTRSMRQHQNRKRRYYLRENLTHARGCGHPQHAVPRFPSRWVVTVDETHSYGETNKW